MEHPVFQQNILSHYRSPRNKGTLEGATFSASESNPLCGDRIVFQVRLGEGRAEEARFSGEGCAISQASASMLTEWVKGKSTNELRETEESDVHAWMGITLSPARRKCALLPLLALRVGLHGYLRETEELRRARHELG